MNALFLALAYLRFHWMRSTVLVAVTALIIFVPFATQLLVSASEHRLTARADATPLLLGRRGSALDLTMNALYFSPERPQPLPMGEVEAIWDSGLATPIPLHTAFETQGARIIGTSLEYFGFRRLELDAGRMLAVLGEAVIGAGVARRLGKGVGDTLVSSPENLFDLAGVYPLEMPIVGVLGPTHGPDDDAVFVDLKTAWVIAGLGHGHEDVLPADADATDAASAAAAVVEYQRITPENLASFHFHGDAGAYPVSAAIVVPENQRAATLLRGRYLDAEASVQLVEPPEIVQGLVDRLFRIKKLLDAVTVVIGLAALAAVALAVFLSYRLRAGEMATAVKLGAQRLMVVRLLAAETVVILGAACALAVAATLTLRHGADGLIGWLLAAGA